MIGSTLAAIVFVSFWVAAWLHWCFDGEIRQFLFSRVFPEPWRSGRERAEVALMTGDEFEIFLAAESSAPNFVRGVLGCPGSGC